MKTQKTTDQTFNAATQNITGRAISYGMDENTNTKMLKSGTQMQRLSYNSTATSGLHCNRMLLQWFNLSSSHLSPFGCNKVTTSVCFTC
ncbi:hypothetical protein DAPPUDRAFT_303034 [Daphnia pulex]|uniref:Uncharacterized protein n=1 Tax=Daphnia pulex TaxID=6669 RepID=E9FTS5_DAPPU|nr:hypothetical protein DAPPUDRAFT_303034 [Daphnia pulex]|eukprot:EFX89420.1 hypothetical protein DAPPUDRAFT_303034 [Daphnia pulex]